MATSTKVAKKSGKQLDNPKSTAAHKSVAGPALASVPDKKWKNKGK